MSLVGIGGFLIGGALGLYLGSEEKSKPCVCSDKALEIEREEYKKCVETFYEDDLENDFEDDIYGTSDAYNVDVDTYNDDVEIISNKKMTVVNQDGEEVVIKDTAEGLVEVVEPYVISEDEFMDPNVFTDFESNTLIYYEEDDVLATDRDEVIDNVEELVGPEALTSFGYMCENKDTVFVRNINLGCNFEIVRETGSYKELILGFPEEDSDYEKARKFFKDLDEERV